MLEANAPVLTIDGPGGSGKGTICKLVAQKLGWNLLDSGALYRLLGLAASNHGVDLTDEPALEILAEHLDVQFIASDESGPVSVVLEGEDVSDTIRTEQAGNRASKVAGFSGVRRALLARQQAFQEFPGLVADGRDMGTVVFPDAPVKVYLTASANERGQRRYKQLIEKGLSVSLAALIEEIQERDDRDMNRAVAPLKPADDAIIIDSTAMGIDEVLSAVLAEVKKKALI
jgi:cytidylate kinase